eukprot:2034743-Pleurochrysis_carterae.AAC.1
MDVMQRNLSIRHGGRVAWRQAADSWRSTQADVSPDWWPSEQVSTTQGAWWYRNTNSHFRVDSRD